MSNSTYTTHKHTIHIQDIEERLKSPLYHLDSGYTLPAQLRDAQSKTTYGEKQTGGDNTVFLGGSECICVYLCACARNGMFNKPAHLIPTHSPTTCAHYPRHTHINPHSFAICAHYPRHPHIHQPRNYSPRRTRFSPQPLPPHTLPTQPPSHIAGHMEQLKPIVAELAVLEDKAQRSFWNLKTKFNHPK